MLFRSLAVATGVALLASVSPCQKTPSDGAQATDNNAVSHSDKHILGIIPNFRTSPTLDHYAPISSREKFKIAQQDSFDRGTFLLAAAFAGKSQLSEVFGNATAVAISNSYYRNHRDASDAVSSLGVQLGVDMTANILKEFWPDFDHKFRRKHSDDADTANHR